MNNKDLKSDILAEINAGGRWPFFRPKTFAENHGISINTVYRCLKELSSEGKVFKYRIGRRINYTCIELEDMKSLLVK